MEPTPAISAISESAATAAIGQFNYLDETVESSLYRNGRVHTRRDRDGSDSPWEGLKIDARRVPVHDARRLAEAARKNLASHGFELLTRPLRNPDLDFFDHQAVMRSYYPECAELVRASTGAAHVFAFDHNVRSAVGKKNKQPLRGGQQVQGPAHIVHGDYTLTSAPERLKRLALPPGENDTFRAVLAPGEALVARRLAERGLEDRFAIVNVWRNITLEPVATHPLALCDGQSVLPEDLVVFEIHYQDRIGENYFAKHASRHRWYTYPAMSRDEPLLIKQWDSWGTLARTRGKAGDGPDGPCTFSFHSAFEDPATPPDAPDRWSIEVRCIAVYPSE